jgi:ABC-type multidrug transport system ATPase subunit
LSAPDAPVYRELTAFENLEFIARVRGCLEAGDALATHLNKWLPRVRHNDPAGDLSSGLRTRLQLAVATLHAPLILLLDEPSANLDDAGRALLHEALDEQRRLGLALVATNDPREAKWCDTRIEL